MLGVARSSSERLESSSGERPESAATSPPERVSAKGGCPPSLAIRQSLREGQLRIKQLRRDRCRARSGQRWATDLEACRRSGVVGGKVVERPATTLWLIGPKSVQKGL